MRCCMRQTNQKPATYLSVEYSRLPAAITSSGSKYEKIGWPHAATIDTRWEDKPPLRLQKGETGFPSPSSRPHLTLQPEPTVRQSASPRDRITVDFTSDTLSASSVSSSIGYVVFYAGRGGGTCRYTVHATPVATETTPSFTIVLGCISELMQCKTIQCKYFVQYNGLHMYARPPKTVGALSGRVGRLVAGGGGCCSLFLGERRVTRKLGCST